MKKTALKNVSFKRIGHYIKPYRVLLICSFLCAMVSSAAQLLIPIFCGNAIDYMLGAGKVSFEGVLKFIGCIGITTLVAAIAQQFMATSNNRITYGMSKDLRNEITGKIHKLPLAYLDRHPIGDLVSRTISDVDTFSDGMLMGFSQLFTGVITIIGTLAIMLYYNVAITLIVVILTPLSLFAASFISKRTHRYFTKQALIRGEETALINELIDGQKVVRAYHKEQETLKEFDEINEQLGTASLKATFFSSLTNPSTRLVNNIVYAGVSLASGLYALGKGITIGQLSVFLSYASQYAKPFNEISGVITELQNAFACIDRVFELLDENEEIPDKKDAKVLQAGGAVTFESISFAYEKNQSLIKNINLDVRPGQRIAIAGPTGCGKTTLINLLMRFYDVNKGRILIDGVDVRDMTRKSLRQNFGMVLQDTWLKSGTIKENIAYGKADATEEEIIAAAKKAHAHSFIRRLPEGYDTVIGENGDSISAGQKQLLCIARVMLSLPPVLILDEATSSIDTRTELKIQAAFDEMMKGRTSFIVAHRLSTIQNADVILVMKDGTIIEQGNHESLLAKGGFYANLYQSQFAVNEG